jgi:hypothetical protein
MLCLGFAGEVIESCDHEGVQQRASGLLQQRLDQFVNESTSPNKD